MKVRNDCEIVYLVRAIDTECAYRKYYEAYDVVIKFFVSNFFPFMQSEQAYIHIPRHRNIIAVNAI